ncbi:hypothetical protein [Azotobacter chroococcum]|uniref:hypothetical protein n=1 Tax=Azotobacter chroococcum TaxID=353 RepID=UPI000B7791EF|nr:hypothetical protein [Azotobacter chroococcum]
MSTPTTQPYAWLGAAGLYRTQREGVANGEQQLTPLYLHPATATQASADVLAERIRQIEQEQWCPEHDDQYTRGELATAAAAYATSSHWHAIGHKSGIPPARWPWDQSGWKPTTPRRDLVKAGALILAEIERLDRIEAKEGSPCVTP